MNLKNVLIVFCYSFLIACNSKNEVSSESSTSNENKTETITDETPKDVNAQLNEINNKLKAAGIDNFEKHWLKLTREIDNDEFYILQSCEIGTPEIKMIYDEANYCYVLEETWAQDSKNNLVVDFKETTSQYEFTIKDYDESDLSKSLSKSSKKLVIDIISSEPKLIKLKMSQQEVFLVAAKNKNQYETRKENCD